MATSNKVVLALKRHWEEKETAAPFPNAFPKEALFTVIFPAYASSSTKQQDASLGQSECKQLLIDLSLFKKKFNIHVTVAGFSVAWGKCKSKRLSANGFKTRLLTELASKTKPKATKREYLIGYVSCCKIE